MTVKLRYSAHVGGQLRLEQLGRSEFFNFKLMRPDHNAGNLIQFAFRNCLFFSVAVSMVNWIFNLV